MTCDRLKEEGRPAGSGKDPGRSCGGQSNSVLGTWVQHLFFLPAVWVPHPPLWLPENTILCTLSSPLTFAPMTGRAGHALELQTTADIQGSMFISEKSSALWGGTRGGREVVGIKSRGSFWLLKTQAGLGEAEG